MTRKARSRQQWRPPSAADHNAMAAAADMYRRGPDGTPQRALPVNPSVVTVKNSTGAAKRRHEVVALSRTPILTAVTREQIYIAGGTPAAGAMPKAFAVFLDPCERNAYAPAQIAGVCPALVYVNATTDHFCDLPAGEDRFVSNETGPVQILQQPNATGEQTCIVNLSHQEESHLVGVPVGDGITARSGTTAGTGYCQVYYLNSSGVLTAVSEGSAAVYVPVYSLSEDPILPQANNTFDGGSYIGQGTLESYYPLHCDQFGTWWIEKEYDSQEAVAYGPLNFWVGGSQIGRNAGEAVASAYTWATSALSIDELDIYAAGDAGLLTPLFFSIPSDNAFLQLNKTGDYRITCDWGGATTVAANAVLTYDVQYQNGGTGAWASMFPQWLYQGVCRPTTSDRCGAPMSFSRRLLKSTRFRGELIAASGTYHDSSGNAPFYVTMTVSKTK